MLLLCFIYNFGSKFDEKNEKWAKLAFSLILIAKIDHGFVSIHNVLRIYGKNCACVRAMFLYSLFQFLADCILVFNVYSIFYVIACAHSLKILMQTIVKLNQLL